MLLSDEQTLRDYQDLFVKHVPINLLKKLQNLSQNLSLVYERILERSPKSPEYEQLKKLNIYRSIEISLKNLVEALDKLSKEKGSI